jgi:hypothetical protein
MTHPIQLSSPSVRSQRPSLSPRTRWQVVMRSALVVGSGLLFGVPGCNVPEDEFIGCSQDGKVYDVGDAVPSSDDCNSCGCMDDGTIACTLIDCSDPSGGGPGSGGAVGSSGGQLNTGGAEVPSGGQGGEGGAFGEACTAPFEIGDCDAAIPVYFHNTETGLCEPAVYGGCGGNDNRYQTMDECQSACGVVPGGASCEVHGITYPHGSGRVPDPASCNTCSCEDGVVGGCTEIGCSEECPAGQDYAFECAKCGPVDECLSVRSGCFDVCEDQDDCEESGGQCLGGFCRNFCG